ncbi:MAG: glycosyltransferase family 4 protein [Anaerolineales bacterium]|nr:glycosyltransferase family 4 protein [Anaerolineales bacterium]
MPERAFRIDRIRPALTANDLLQSGCLHNPQRECKAVMQWMPWLTRLFSAEADIAVFHDFRRPPFGGGNQFMLALSGELEGRGFRVERNRLSPSSRACLFNSFNFDFRSLRRAGKSGSARMVHRVDGPVDRYRGDTRGVDRRIWEINREVADATIFQSQYSLDAHRELGFEFRAPIVIHNAVDPAVFFPGEARLSAGARKTRLVSSSWSDNLNKGAAVYKWLEENLDWGRYEYTFVGRSPVRFDRIRMQAPVAPRRLAALLREHDIFITASLHDPCSNALLEALACGLPAIYARSGGHPELVGDAGYGFDNREEIPELLACLVGSHELARRAIDVPRLARVGTAYLKVMGLRDTAAE